MLLRSSWWLFESKDFLLFALFSHICYLRASDSFFKFASTCLLVSLCFCYDSLECIHSLSHATMQRGLNGMEMIMYKLSEPAQEWYRLIHSTLKMTREQSKWNDTVWVFFFAGVREDTQDALGELIIMIDDGWRVLNISLAIWKFEKEDSCEGLISDIIELQREVNCYLWFWWNHPEFLISSVWNLIWVGRVSSTYIYVFNNDPYQQLKAWKPFWMGLQWNLSWKLRTFSSIIQP